MQPRRFLAKPLGEPRSVAGSDYHEGNHRDDTRAAVVTIKDVALRAGVT
jgi:hypothetical protein